MNGEPTLDRTLACGDDRRREQVRAAERNGLDYVEVHGGGRILLVHFLGKAPPKIGGDEPIEEANVLIDGGRSVRDIRVVDVEVRRQDEDDLDDYIEVEVDRVGDSSPYRLRLVEQEGGYPTEKPMADFDVRYASVEFVFGDDGPTELDCKVPETYSPQQYAQPEIDYLAKDYASFRQLILDRLSLTMPDWRERHVPDVGVAMVELLAYVADHLSYHQDAVATESYLQTARQRVSVRRHARLVDYDLHEGCNARAWVCVCVEAAEEFAPNDLAFLAVNEGSRVREAVVTEEDRQKRNAVLTEKELRALPASQYVWFEPLHERRSTLRPGDIRKPAELAARLSKPLEGAREERDPLSQYLAGQIPEKLKNEIEGLSNLPEGHPPRTTPEDLRSDLAGELNYLIRNDVLYGQQRFTKEMLDQEGAEGDLRREIAALVERRSREQEDVSLLNRLVLEAAYPDELARSGLIYLWAAHDKISFYTWGQSECCLPRGATAATLRDDWDESEEPGPDRPPRKLHLQEGDILVFEELIGPETGNEADADRTRRHAVRLTRVKPSEDELYRTEARGFPEGLPTPVVEIEWSEEDELPFPLCVSAVGPAPECVLLEDISVARGNVILVDHGRTEKKQLGPTPGRATTVRCEGEGVLRETALRPEAVRLCLKKGPLTFSEPFQETPASGVLRQDPHLATPWISAQADTGGAPDDTIAARWTARRDLLGSDDEDRHFVVEIDNKERAWLRFGDGDLGRAPEPGTLFRTSYRIGNGPSGNVGAEAISRLYFRGKTESGVRLTVRNPLPAQGGTQAETLEQAKLLAPQAFRREVQRAISPEDYAKLAERHPGVQRAVATFRWAGSWDEVVVTVDPRGRNEVGQQLLREIGENLLANQRRIGHDVRASGAEYVPLDLELEIRVLPHYSRGHVKAALLDLFSSRVLPGGRRGFFHPDENAGFGEGVTLSKIVAAAQAVTGVEMVKVKTFKRLHEKPNGEIEAGFLPLDPLEIARLDIDQPEGGRLRLEMRGGR